MSHGCPWTAIGHRLCHRTFSCQLLVNAARVSHFLDAETEFSQVPSLCMGIHWTLRYLNLTFIKAAGPDKVSEIGPILTIILNKSLTSSIVPDDWRKANVTPSSKKVNDINPPTTGQFLSHASQPFQHDSCDILTKNNIILVPNLYNNYSGLVNL